MDTLDSMNAAIDYIEEHLDKELDYQQAARIACFSEHHFKRMFSFLSGVPLSEYVRRRRLTLAALELRDHNKKVIDVALKYGYQSPDSFSRAFQELHHTLPSTVKHARVTLKAYPRITFQLSIKGDVEMKYRFVEKNAFKTVGYKEIMHPENGDFNPTLWNTLTDADYRKLQTLEREDTDLSGVLNITVNTCHGPEKSEEALEYYIAVVTNQPAPNDLAALEISKHLWAVFDAEGKMPDALTNTWSRIYTDWFPTSGYELTEAPEIVKSIDDTKTEIWIPVRKR
ncbi:AraC family transcriptional regulator [Oceanobacillus sojae]|uniref:Putative HTH-type transcriptional regulator YdeE n=1 Tax=Oceanobacillus sojae TaxID=582851 RepID=A0A511ZFU3_9BACI|nr:AraC family transcriptional regulator [Oceanobacillus sojae]GEN86290.1 putative HTH-type transcriptional regulator YdeE [Oceanobacillus sojae]